MRALVIYTPKKRLIRNMLVSVAFVAIGIWMLAFPAEEIGLDDTLAAYIGIPFFGFCGLFFLSRLLWPKPAVVVDEAGLLDNASACGVGLIPWTEIRDVRIASFMNQPFLAVYVADPEKYLRRANPLKRAIMRANQSWVGTVSNIPLSALSISADELHSVVRKHLRTGMVNG
ncbi:MAG: hypothetical protein JNJ50_19235 [Acidobacteria bacterium]|nr:hypothetical protein [Acidobacteriota bacterium]